MRILITGVSGFAGRHLAAHLLERGHEVCGTVHRADSRERLGHLRAAFPPLSDAHIQPVDVRDPAAVAGVIAAVRPDAIFHLAGIADVGTSHGDPGAVLLTNTVGTLHLLAGVRRHQPACRVVTVGSGDAYGRIEPGDLPAREDCPFRPVSPYGTSKAAADLVAYQWAKGYGLDIVRVRPFNHTGPGQRPGFVCPDLARQLAAIEQGRQAPTLTVGNLDVIRDFSDVRDIVAGYVAAWEKGRTGEAYNVCSGTGRSVREVLETLIDLSRQPVEVVVEPARVRKTDVPTLIGSPERLRAQSGWRPQVAWRQTLADVLDDWRRRDTDGG